MPIIVYEEDMPMEQDRDRDFPAAKMSQFIKILKRKGHDLIEIFDKIKREYNSYPFIETEFNYSQYSVGEYEFHIPEMTLKSSRNKPSY